MGRNWFAFLFVVAVGGVFFFSGSLPHPHGDTHLFPADVSRLVGFERVGPGLHLKCQAIHSKWSCEGLGTGILDEKWIDQTRQFSALIVQQVVGPWGRFRSENSADRVIMLRFGDKDVRSFEFGMRNDYLKADYVFVKETGEILLVPTSFGEHFFGKDSEMLQFSLVPQPPEKIRRVIRMSPSEATTLELNGKGEWTVDSRVGDSAYIRGWIRELTSLNAQKILVLSPVERESLVAHSSLSLIISFVDGSIPQRYIRLIAGTDPKLSDSKEIFYAVVEGQDSAYILTAGSARSLFVRSEAFSLARGE